MLMSRGFDISNKKNDFEIVILVEVIVFGLKCCCKGSWKVRERFVEVGNGEVMTHGDSL